ncbi:MAG: 50S ribosomal protein L10 [Verrucomicrobia bacterium]|nr:50S ribosomal protein L10 [Verrucomicrobiota bacterium]
MQVEKQIIIDEILERINNSPYTLVAEYTGMTVPQFADLRNRLAETGAEIHVGKNALVKRAADTAGLPEAIGAELTGQNALVTGEQDVCAAAKVLKDFRKECEKPTVKIGSLDGELLDAEQIDALASLPPMEVLQAQFLGVLLQPATKLVRVLNEPGTSLARVLAAKGEQG